jgi:hypothetical protein
MAKESKKRKRLVSEDLRAKSKKTPMGKEKGLGDKNMDAELDDLFKSTKVSRAADKSYR